MHVDGNNGTENVQQKPTITEQFDNLTKDVGQSDYQLANNLAGLNETVNNLSKDVNKKITEFFNNDDNLTDANGNVKGKISTVEKSQLETISSSAQNLYYTLRGKMNNLGKDTTELFKKIQDNLLNIMNNTRTAKTGEMPEIETEDEVVSRNQAQEPDDTDANNKQAVMNETQWLASVSDDVRNAYLRIVNPENYQGHGGPRDVAQKSPNGKIGGLLGIIRDFKLNQAQVNFLKREIEIYKEQAKLNGSQDSSEQSYDTQSDEQFGSKFYKTPGNGEKYYQAMTSAAHEENDKFYEAMTGKKPPKK